MTPDRLSVILLLVGICGLLAATIITLLDFIFRRRSLRRMNDMIQAAIDGNFKADHFDESLCASVENRLAEYLAMTETQMGKVAAEQEKTKSLIADISHQTKTPIANLLLYTELLKEEEGREIGETAALLENQVKKLDFFIQSLVKLSRLETGILALRLCRSEVAPLLEEVREQYAARAEEKGIYLRVLSEEAREVTACFDPKWTLEALDNLVDNAIKYTQTGGITVRVKPYELFVCIEVADTGIGVAEEEHSKIFERFYRSMAVAHEQGVGIGLYLTREILRQESGYIQLASKLGEGAVFSMFLPKD